MGVLAGGIDVVYPPEHEELQRRIGETGCLITEMPPGFVPRGKEFPRRNRIISGVSLAVLVVEAARRSGTLVTARFAGEQGREVFAVPGHPLDPRAEGTNKLLKTGATLVTEPGDILEALEPIAGVKSRAFREIAPEPPPDPPPRLGPPPSLSDGERNRVLAALGPQPDRHRRTRAIMRTRRARSPHHRHGTRPRRPHRTPRPPARVASP